MTPLTTPARTAGDPAPGNPSRGLVPGDLVRVGALVSVLGAAAASDGVAVALFALVLGGTVVPRATAAPTGLDVASGVVTLAAAWCAVAGLYERVEGLDLLVHGVATGVLAVLAHHLLHRRDRAARPSRTRRAAAATTVALGALLAVVWELLEVLGHTFVDDTIYVTPADTAGDLAAGLVGCVAAAWFVARRHPRAPARARA